MKKILFWLLLTGISSTVIAQQKKTITHEDLWLMKRVGSPQISPDGRWVVFNVTEPSYNETETVNDLWLVAADGSSAPRKITALKSAEGSYQWSPDSRFIAFTARREGDEAAQVYLLNLREGGEAQRFTSLSTGAGAPRWSPDGKMIMFSSSVFPGGFADSTNKRIAEERKKIKYKARVYTEFPIRNFDRWLDDKVSHLFVQHVDSSRAVNLLQGVTIARENGFRLSNAAWSADGKTIVFAATTENGSAAYQELITHLYAVPIAGGDARQLTRDSDSYSSPQFSPDGRYLFAMSSAARNNKVYNLDYITRFDWPSMQNKTVMARQLDRPVNNFVVSGNTIYFSAESTGRDMIYTMPVTGGNPQLLSRGGVGSYTGVSVSNNGTIVASFESSAMPAEIIRLNTATGSHAFLSSFNADKLRQLDLPPVEEIWTTSSRGKQIHSWIVKPAGFDATKKYPLFVVMHGGPHSAWKDNWGYRWNYHLLAAPGYVLVLTDYTGSTGYGEKFAQDIQFDPFKGPADEINEAAADAVKRFAFIDGSRQAAGGASYGGHLANWLQGTTTHYKALVSHAGLVNSEVQWGTSDYIYHREIMGGGPPWEQSTTWTQQNPIRLAANFRTPVLVTIGELDYRVPLNNALEYWSALKRMKVPSKLIVFPEENHWILKAENSRFFYQQVHEWLDTYLR